MQVQTAAAAVPRGVGDRLGDDEGRVAVFDPDAEEVDCGVAVSRSGCLFVGT
ncbi:hypothetical protein ACIRJO_32855 [Streptomyces sp. NPDC102394]|uniref:hypothetical protein n=1 Tax=Streptomyces sp. NPDC102394 TaxID=3366167 RepID=UPI0038022ED1